MQITAKTARNCYELCDNYVVNGYWCGVKPHFYTVWVTQVWSRKKGLEHFCKNKNISYFELKKDGHGQPAKKKSCSVMDIPLKHSGIIETQRFHYQNYAKMMKIKQLIFLGMKSLYGK